MKLCGIMLLSSCIRVRAFYDHTIYAISKPMYFPDLVTTTTAWASAFKYINTLAVQSKAHMWIWFFSLGEKFENIHK